MLCVRHNVTDDGKANRIAALIGFSCYVMLTSSSSGMACMPVQGIAKGKPWRRVDGQQDLFGLAVSLATQRARPAGISNL